MSPWQRACPLTCHGAVVSCLGLLSKGALPPLLSRSFPRPLPCVRPHLWSSTLSVPCPCCTGSRQEEESRPNFHVKQGLTRAVRDEARQEVGKLTQVESCSVCPSVAGCVPERHVLEVRPCRSMCQATTCVRPPFSGPCALPRCV